LGDIRCVRDGDDGNNCGEILRTGDKLVFHIMMRR
jgi:hypothetical protein